MTPEQKIQKLQEDLVQVWKELSRLQDLLKTLTKQVKAATQPTF